VKKVIAVIVFIGLAVGAYYYFTNSRVESASEKPQEKLVEVKRGSITMAVSTTGRVVANLDVDIKCKASGEIVKLPLDISKPVTKGDLLVELDPMDEERYVKQAKASLAASEARLAQAKQNVEIATRNLKTEKKKAQAALTSTEARAEDAQSKFDRVKQLLEKKLTSQEEYDTAETASIQASADLANARTRMEELETQEVAIELKRQDVYLSETQVESDKIALSTAEQRLKDTKVYAPIDGVVSVLNVQIGQIISSGISNVGGGTTILTLSDLSRIFVLASVDESDIGKVQAGQSARITADAYPTLNFRGQVVRIATRGVSTANVVTFEVKIEVLGDNKQLLKPEMTANIEIIAQRAENVPLLPVTAVTRKEGKRIVYVQKPDGSSEEREVEVGISDGVEIAILSGLTEGETVVIRKDEADSRWRDERRSSPMMFGGGRRR
jgi:HlyD family secretion protein